MAELGTAYVRVAGDFSSLRTSLVGLLRSPQWKQLSTGGKAVAGLGAIGAAAGAAGKALYEIGEAFDESYDKITVQTGATGKRLDGLKDSFRNVVRDVPADFDTASTAVAGLNQRLGLTGKPLERLTKQVTELSRITGTDVQENVESITRLFGDWSVKTRDQGETLDKLFRVTQATGIGLSDLSRLMVQFGSPLRQLGLDFDFSAAMFARFEKEGVNIQTLMPGLRMALKNFSAPTAELGKSLKQVGVDLKAGPQEALQDVFEALKNAPTDLKANALAFEVFGARAGPDMAAAVREGRFELDELMRTVKRGDETIRGAGRRTMDFSEQWLKFKNNVLVALEPVAIRVFDTVGDKMKDITKIISDPKLTAGQKWDALSKMASDAIAAMAEKVGQAAPKVAAALIRGIVDAPVWASFIAGGWLVSKLGGLGGGAMGKLGTRLGTRLGTSLGGAAGPIAAGMIGSALAGIKFGRSDFADKYLKNFTDAAKYFGEEFDITAAKAQRVLDFMERNPGLGFPESLKIMNRAAREELEGVRDQIERLENTWGSSLKEIDRDTDRNMKQIERSLGLYSKRGRQAVSDNFLAAVSAIENSMKSGEIKAGEGARKIHEILVEQLRSYGIKDAEGFLSTTAGKASRDQSGTPAPGGKQQGGLIDGAIVPGRGTGDTVPLHIGGQLAAIVEPGELVSVTNRKATAALMKLNDQIPRFREGGVVSRLAGGEQVNLPRFSSTFELGGMIAAGLNNVAEAVESAVGKKLESQPPAVAGGTKGPKGIGNYAGLPMANWVIEALRYAASKGVRPQPTSGYRSRAYNVAQGRDYYSEHEGTQYPHGAVDFGGYTTGLTAKMSVVEATRDFKYPLLAPIGFEDDGHASGTGSRLGGIIFKLAEGGVVGRPLPAVLQRYNRLYQKHVAPDYGGEQMPPDKVAMLAEFFGMPGIAMAQIAKGESNYRPGAVGDDSAAGYGNTFGYGLWQITTGASGMDAVVNSMGGYDQMLNPIKNAIIAGKMHKSRGVAPWFGTQYLTDPNAHWQGEFGNLVRAGQAGGSGADANGGKPKPTKPPKSTAPRKGTLGYIDLPGELGKALQRLRRRTVELDERIANRQILDALSTSPEGEELSPTERAGQVALYDQLLATLTERVAKVKKGIKLSGTGSPRSKRLADELIELTGITGRGGLILDAIAARDSLVGTTTTPTGPSETDSQRASLLEQLLTDERRTNAVIRSQMPTFAAFARAPFGGSFADGGTVPGPPGAARTIIAHGGETVVPEGGQPITFELHVEDGAVDASRIKMIAKNALGEEIAQARGSGPTLNRKAHIPA